MNFINKSIRRQLLIYFIVLSILPTIFIGGYSYFITRRNMERDLTNSLIFNLQQINRNIEWKITKINNYMDTMKNSRDLQDILYNNSLSVFNSKDMGNLVEQLDKLRKIFQLSFINDSDVREAIILSKDGGAYSYNSFISSNYDFKDTEWYKKVNNEDGITWLNNVTNPVGIDDKKYMIIGENIKDVFVKSSLDIIGNFIIIASPNMFLDVLKDTESIKDNYVLILDKQNNIMADQSDLKIDNNNLDMIIKRLPSEGDGSFSLMIDGSPKIVTFSVSKQSGWKAIQITPYEYLTNSTHSIGMFILGIVLILIISINIISYFLIRRFSRPIMKLAGAMKQVGVKNFNVKVDVNSEDEIGVISRGFNEMVENLDNLFKISLEKEKQKRRAQMEALQFQINPHFLYNTLGIIRLTALTESDPKVAGMVLSLSRLLKSTLSNINTLVSVSEEIENIKAYINIQQMRYSHGISVLFEIEDAAKDCKILNMLLQPIVENSIMHGLNERLNEGEEAVLKIAAAIEENKLLISIYDNGTGMEQEKIDQILENVSSENRSSHIGFKNINERIQMFYGEDFGVKIESCRDKYTLVKIYVPLNR